VNACTLRRPRITPVAIALPAPRRPSFAIVLAVMPLTVFTVLAVLATFALAWWQWTRFRSGSGTFQNLGYALQWPLFGAFFVYAYRKFNEYEDEVKQTGISPVEREQETARSRGVVTEITEDFLPERPSMDVETFNRLNAPTRKRRRNDSAQTNSDHDEDQQ